MIERDNDNICSICYRLDRHNNYCDYYMKFININSNREECDGFNEIFNDEDEDMSDLQLYFNNDNVDEIIETYLNGKL